MLPITSKVHDFKHCFLKILTKILQNWKTVENRSLHVAGLIIF